ncbi:MAG TPA: RES family NAD+ phosphorylase [Solirubrobacteraceae bacterium]|nr:RES family NAD+ phosphorylase [Solirubrobacteraceae bacterium]
MLGEGSEVHRIHRTELDPWFFNSGPTWRFNPCQIRGYGACYLGETPVAGLLETFKGLRVVDEAELRARTHFSAILDRPLRLADCCAPAAGEFGVNGEIHTTPDYAIPQLWASALAGAGFAGIRYLCRSDPSLQLIGYALFDRSGRSASGRWPTGSDRPVDEGVVRGAERYGLRFSPAP